MADEHYSDQRRGSSGASQGAPAGRARREARREEQLAAWGAFLRAHAAVKAKLERELLDERGLPLGWYEVLLHLDSRGGELRMQELARSVLLSKSGLTRLVDRMEAAGLVARRTCESDRRGSFVGATPEGITAFRAAAPVHLRGIAEHFTSYLTPAELAVVRSAFDRVADAAEGAAALPRIPCDGGSSDGGSSDGGDDHGGSPDRGSPGGGSADGRPPVGRVRAR